MNKEDLSLLGHLISNLKESFDIFEKAYSKGDMDKTNEAKSEILRIQKQIGEKL
jgi:hypothetical protein